MITLSASPIEGSVIVVTVNFADENGDAFIPVTCVWSLTDKSGTAIGSLRRTASVSSSSHNFVISGDDLLYSAGKSRVFTVEGTYTNTNGSNLPFRSEASFGIQNTVLNPA